MLLQADAGFGQRAGLVRAQDVHAAQIMNGSQALDDDLLLCHAQGATGQGHGDHHGQKLWS